jgi:hypothetical protein
MFQRLLIMVALSTTILMTNTRATLAFQATYRLPCMIFYSSEVPIATNCLANIKTSGNSWVETVTTQNGKSFIIQRNGAAQWYLNHETSDRVSDEPNTCYQNRKVKLCL